MIVVTGATGRFGSAVVRTLRSLDLPVRTMVRDGAVAPELEELSEAEVEEELRKFKKDVKEVLEGVQTKLKEGMPEIRLQ